MLKVFLKLILKLILGHLSGLAIRTVQSLEDVDMSNEKKRKKAFKDIKESLKLSGKELQNNLINLAIESALTYVRK